MFTRILFVIYFCLFLLPLDGLAYESTKSNAPLFDGKLTRIIVNPIKSSNVSFYDTRGKESYDYSSLRKNYEAFFNKNIRSTLKESNLFNMNNENLIRLNVDLLKFDCREGIPTARCEARLKYDFQTWKKETLLSATVTSYSDSSVLSGTKREDEVVSKALDKNIRKLGFNLKREVDSNAASFEEQGDDSSLFDKLVTSAVAAPFLLLFKAGEGLGAAGEALSDPAVLDGINQGVASANRDFEAMNAQHNAMVSNLNQVQANYQSEKRSNQVSYEEQLQEKKQAAKVNCEQRGGTFDSLNDKCVFVVETAEEKTARLRYENASRESGLSDPYTSPSLEVSASGVNNVSLKGETERLSLHISENVEKSAPTEIGSVLGVSVGLGYTNRFKSDSLGDYYTTVVNGTLRNNNPFKIAVTSFDFQYSCKDGRTLDANRSYVAGDYGMLMLPGATWSFSINPDCRDPRMIEGSMTVEEYGDKHVIH